MSTAVITPDQGPISLPYNNTEMTQAINILPAQFGQMEAEGYFPPKPLATKYFKVAINNGVVTALPVTGDGPATLARHGSKEVRIFEVPQIKHQDDVLAEDIASWLDLSNGSEDPETFDNLFNERLAELKLKFELTRELMRISALKGAIVDGRGTEILNLFDAFEISKKIVYFDLDNESSDFQANCDLVYQLITQDLSDETMTTVIVKVSRQWFNKMIKRADVKQYWLNAQQALELANVMRGRDGAYRPRSLTVHNITFEEISAVIPMWGGTNQPAIAATKGHAYPGGTLRTHMTFVAPPKDIRVLNGKKANVNDWIHLTQEPMKHGEGVEILGRANIMPMWNRPKLLVELDSGSGTSTVPIGG